MFCSLILEWVFLNAGKSCGTCWCVQAGLTGCACDRREPGAPWGLGTHSEHSYRALLALSTATVYFSCFRSWLNKKNKNIHQTDRQWEEWTITLKNVAGNVSCGWMCKWDRIISSCSCFHRNYKKNPNLTQENFYSVANSMKGKEENTNIAHSFSNTVCVLSLCYN